MALLHGPNIPILLNPALWLDASDGNTLFDATVGGNLVTANGAVAKWNDKSGNQNHATQSTLAYRPIRKTNVVNNKDALFPTNQYFNLTTPINLSTHTIFAVFSRPSTGVWNTIIAYSGASTPYGPLWGTDNHIYFFPNASFLDSGITTNVGNFIISAVQNGSNSNIFLNGISVAAGLLGTTSNYDQIMTRGNNISGNYFNGYFMELIILPYAASTEQRTNVENYLKTKWKIAPLYS